MRSKMILAHIGLADRRFIIRLPAPLYSSLFLSYYHNRLVFHSASVFQSPYSPSFNLSYFKSVGVFVKPAMFTQIAPLSSLHTRRSYNHAYRYVSP